MNLLTKISSFFDALFVRPRNLKVTEKGQSVINSMKATEKLLFGLFGFVVIISSLVLVFRVHRFFLIEVPAYGGSFTEGVVGNLRFVNPVLAISDTDKELTTLMYSGLLKKDTPGNLVNDLAESLNISEDGLTYEIKIRDDAFFHDNTPVTSNDVAFTIEKVLDPVIKSPRRANWEGVSIETTSDKTLRFILKKPYGPFVEALTLGVLPKHIWSSVSSEEFPFSEWNVNPIGTGPYKIDYVKRNSAGIPNSISLSAWSKYVGGRPFIKNLNFKFFSNDEDLKKAYEAKEIDSLARIGKDSARILDQKADFISTASPRVFGAFFNQNSVPAFLNKEVRQALDLSAPKDQIVEKVLFGYGSVALGPLPEQNRKTEETTDNIAEAKELLKSHGWQIDEADGILKKKTKSETIALSFTISTADTPELRQTAEMLQSAWQALGANVEIKIFEASDLNQNVIRPRKYDILLFGQAVSNPSELYSFWHSSQRNDPGLNVPLYTNITADKILEELRTEAKTPDQQEKIEALTLEIKKDIPAVFLFVPDTIYLPAQKIKNISLPEVSSPNERFNSVSKWFIETDKVWSLFAQI